ncbi:MAG: DUF302 domain-containing protein [Elainellaceae cyanobacterium]
MNALFHRVRLKTAIAVGLAEILGLGLSLAFAPLIDKVHASELNETYEAEAVSDISSDMGMVIRASSYSVAETGDRLEALLTERGVTVFARIDHAAGADSVDLSLRPTQVIIFGNPQVGTPLMQCAQSVAIDLPQKALIWEDAEGQVYLGYNDPAYLADRHEIEGCDEAIARVSMILMNLTETVVGAD